MSERRKPNIAMKKISFSYCKWQKEKGIKWQILHVLHSSFTFSACLNGFITEIN